MIGIKLEAVSKIYNSTIAVDNVSFEVEAGEFLVLVGSSGCGKSSILRMIAGLEEINQGSIYFADKLINNIPASERNIGMVFQNYALYPHLSVYDNIAFPLQVRKVDKSQIEKKVKETAEMMGLIDYLGRKPKQLSGGQRQRVAVARAIVREADLFLFDEPLSNLDAKLRANTRVEISKIQKKLGITSIYVTHDQTEAMTMGDRIAVLDKGILHQIASPKEIYHKPNNLFVAAFLGSPQMNILEGELIEDSSNINNQALKFIENESNLAIHIADFKKLVHKNKDIDFRTVKYLGIRPEFISYKNDKESNEKTNIEARPYINVEIDAIEFLGNEYLYYFKTKANLKCARMNHQIPNAKIGDKLELEIEISKILLFDASGNLI